MREESPESCRRRALPEEAIRLSDCHQARHVSKPGSTLPDILSTPFFLALAKSVG